MFFQTNTCEYYYRNCFECKQTNKQQLSVAVTCYFIYNDDMVASLREQSENFIASHQSLIVVS